MKLNQIEKINIPDEKLKLLEKKGLFDTIDACYIPPRKYYHFENKNSLDQNRNGLFSRIEGTIIKIKTAMGKYGGTEVKIQVSTKEDNPEPTDILHITYHGKYMYDFHKDDVGKHVIVCGKLSYAYGCYCMIDPLKFAVDAVGFDPAWDVVFPKYSKIGADWLKSLCEESMWKEELHDTMPEYVRNAYGIKNRRESLTVLKNPRNKEDVQKGILYSLVEDMMYYACASERIQRLNKKESPFIAKKDDKMRELIKLFPYDLTEDQAQTVDKIKTAMTVGDRANEIIQGDVGCGKTVVAFLLLTLMAENGYQAVLMAPTLILATQHYEEYKAYADKLGINVAFLGGKQSTKEKKEILKGIKEGLYSVIIGTHSTISDPVTYNNLGLVMVDEEHRFGVLQREALAKKASDGAHTISFSATPIPRSMASTIYGDKGIHEIKTMPAGRKPIKTQIISSDSEVFSFVKNQLLTGAQVYVVCPLIDTEDNDSPLKSVKDTAILYEKTLNVPVGVVTGAQSKEKTEEALNDFKAGKTKILVATTVVEVGVNIPNATVMIIEDAYMFGLSQLHQLRGRVGRGDKQGYCILKTNRDTERLNVLCRTTDGFVIAEEDMRLRGVGNLIGTEQNGNNHYFQLILNYPNYFKKAKVLAASMVDNDEDLYLISEIERKCDKNHIVPQKIRFYET